MSTFANWTLILFNRFLQVFRVPVVYWIYQRKVNDIVSIDNSDIFFQYEKRLYLIFIYLTIETVFKTADLEKKSLYKEN